ncbi:MAG: UPF0175 family protein [Ignavibacteriae bacterium]|nr:UPF0175 family protein [Ignavibacteriota bacterium]
MLIIDDEFVQATQKSEQELRVEIALLLYAQEMLSFGQARKLAGMDAIEFEQLLFTRKIPNAYSEHDLDSDLATLEQFKHT